MNRVSRFSLSTCICGGVSLLPVVSCTTDGGASSPVDAAARDATVVLDATATGEKDAFPTVSPDAMAPPGSYCALPGSVVSLANGAAVVPGADPSQPDISSWLRVPSGFCAHYFGSVLETRQVRFSPGGDLFVASPSAPTAGGASGGMGKVLVLPDDNHDGLADSTLTYLDNMGSTQGMTFASGYFYVQNGVNIQRVAFRPGDRKPSGAVEAVTTITAQQTSDHWPKVLDMDRSGTLYVSNGSTQDATCVSPAIPLDKRDYNGAIFKVNADGSNSLVAQGFRNPIAMRCESDHDVCLVAELAKDGSGDEGGREKLVPIRQGDDWGFPCCATANVPYGGVQYQDTQKTPDCSGVTPETVSFEIGHTPFGLDFETGAWPAPWKGRVFVALHGDVGSWIGARVVGIALDPATGMPLPATDLDSGNSSAPNMMDFVTGWDDNRQDHGRPAAVTFAPDGRMFVGNDMNGQLVWIAPIALMRPPKT
jgi:glucose/arabinose dehydrogenase